MTLRPVQALFRSGAKLLLLAGAGAGLAGCRTMDPVEPKPAVVQTQKVAVVPKMGKPVEHIGELSPAPGPTPVESKEVVRLEPVPEPEQLQPVTLNNGRLISQTPRLWIAQPTRHLPPNDRAPSLLEDAAITSTLHSRLKSLLTTRALEVQCRTTSGKVSLRAGKLNREEAQTLVDEALALDQVREVELTADFQP